MQSITITRNTACETAASAIPKLSVNVLTEQGLNATLYYLHEGSALTISHDLVTLADGSTETGWDPLETIVHFCAKGRLRYVFPDREEILGLFDSITFHALQEDVVVEVLEDAVLLISSTPEADVSPEGDSVLDKLMNEIGDSDHYTRLHCNHVALYTSKLALLMHVQGNLAPLSRAASLHDIGKVKIPADVLNKPGKLTDEEFSIIKRHPALGHEILQDYLDAPEVLQAVLQHHERLDGSGYPLGLRGDAINMDARILMVADVFDALTTDRVYRKAFTAEKALGIMQQDADAGKLDKNVLAALRAGLKTGQIEIYKD